MGIYLRWACRTEMRISETKKVGIWCTYLAGSRSIYYSRVNNGERATEGVSIIVME